MNYLTRLLLGLGLAIPMSVWAQGAVTKQYLNLYYKSKELYIGLYKKNCVAGNSSEEGTCVKSYEIKPAQSVRSAFVNAISQQWISGTPDATKMQSATLNLATDIDFGYTFENGSCSENFDFLPFSGLSFNGHNHMMSNFCRIDNGQTKRYLGLFGEVVGDQKNGNKTIRNLIISNVHFAVTSGEPALTSGGDYQPAGALASRISNSTVTNVKLKDVVIQAPLAGGLAGFIENSTIKGISTVDNSFIKVTNGISITEDYIGKVIYKYGENVAVFDPYKVLLGGLAGAAYFTNFEDIDLAVQVENKAAVDMSALGGLVGHYVYAPKSNQFSMVTNRDSKITKVNIHGSSSDVGVNAFISGGTAMGGILGASRRLDNNNSPITEFSISQSTVTNLDIKQSRFKISDVDATQKLYLGGVVGNADLCNGGILKIIESNVVNANIEESILENGNFQYYMGGIAGFASCDHVNNSGNRNDLYLTLQKSNASGNIKLDGGYSKTGKTSLSVRTSAAMGGLVGDAIVSLDEGGISENESKVSISYKAKRSASDDLDSVLVGGFFGGLSLFNSPIDYVRLTKLSYEGLIDIEDDGITARVGGIVGKFPMIQSGNSKIEFSNVQVTGDSEKDNNIVSYSGETKSSSTSSSIGGICGMCLSPREISKSSVDGNFKGSSGTDAPKKDFHVGGLIGTVDAKADIDIIKSNYFIGSIENKLNKSGSKGKAGYLFGYLTGDGLGNKPKIISNFHYGSDNVGAIGYFSNYGDFQNVTYFNEDGFNKFVAKNNVRNSSAKNLQEGENGSTMNGTVTASYMKSKDFAAFLNGPWSDEDDRVWTFGTTSDFPFFGTPAVLTFTVVFKDSKGNQIGEAEEVSYGAAAVAPEAPKITGKCFSGWSKPIDKVTESMEVVAEYSDGVCKYKVTFNDLNSKPMKNTVAEDGTPIPNPQQVEEGKSAIVPKSPERSGKRCFLKWDDTDALNDYKNVTHDNIVVSALSKECYEVFFYGLDGQLIVDLKTEDGKSLDNPQIIDKGKAAAAPKEPEPTADGKCFAYWDEDFSNVTQKLLVNAKSKPCEYTVKFYDLRGFVIEGSEQEVLYGEAAVAPTDPPSKDDLCFIGWDTDFSEVKGYLEVKPNTKKCVFTVKFYGLDGTTVIKTQNVQEGLPARAPTTPEQLGDLCFDGWDTDFSEVKGDLEVKAKTKACLNSSSSDQQQSSSSSSSEISSESSSSSSVENGDNYSSSSAGNGDGSSSSAGNDKYSSSSSVNDESSSSSAEHKKYLLDIAEPTATQDGKGLRMQFDSQLANMSENVDYHIQVVSQKGIYLDTIVDGKTVGDVKNGTWRLDPAPAGRYTVTFMITDGVDSIPYSKTFTSMESQEVATHSWQTLSLYAFCRDKGDECLSELEARFARQQQNWAAEQCEEMKAQVKNGTAPDDDYFYREMDDACAQANGLNATTAVYWWDESNPIGDYWQYRKFSVNDKFDSTRGYWYGPIDNEPLVMSLETPGMKDEIVWKLENKYSGWNLVANPFGWYVTLPKEKGLQFYKWDPEVSSYKEPDTLGPYEAIWVRTEKSMTYRIPLKAAIVLEEEKKSLNKSVAAEEWNLRVVLADNNGKRDSWNELAVGTASSLGEPPAGMGDRVNLSIMDGKKRLVKSVKPNADDLEWDLEVSATTTREGYLSFEGLEGVWAKGLHVYATVDNETVEVVKDRPLDVKLSSKAKNVSVRVTKSAVVAAATKSLLKGLRVNQTPNVLNVGFDAAAKLAGAKVKISVVGIDGRIVATGNAVANAGTNAIAMKKPKQGVYFVKVKVGSLSAVTRIMVR